jgi:His-Xaa-Ser system radical SAM maturase HxsC
MNAMALSGRVETAGFTDTRRALLRLADPVSTPIAEADAALVSSVDDCATALASGFKSAVAVGDVVEALGGFRRTARFGRDLDWLAAGDVVAVEPSAGRYRTLWRRNSVHNAFLVTDRCDHRCLMCSQPPKDVDDGWIVDEIRDCLPLLPPDTATVGFTGGEPFLDWERFVPVAGATQAALPRASVHVLTNGRAFARADVVEAWSRLDKTRACLGIPIYSAVDALHDYIVQSPHAFDDTVLGILRLKDKGNRVEVRVVLHKLTVERLAETCEWLARNLPFVDHVALMGMEDTGFALANQQILWVDPVDYVPVLARSVRTLSSAGLRVSIYNLPLCVLPEAIRHYSVQSISDWKNAHANVCAPCGERGRCAGFFTTGRTRMSRGISPIKPVASA